MLPGILTRALTGLLVGDVLSLALLPVLLHVLPILQLRPPVPPPTSAGIIANTVIRLNIAELHVPRFRETS